MAGSVKFQEKYNLYDEIGAGAFSIVYSCRNKKTGKLYACKQLEDRFVSLSEVNQTSEVKTLKRIPQHPNLLKLVEMFFDPTSGRVCLVFDLMQKDLYDLLDTRVPERPFPISEVKSMMRNLLEGLNHLHSHGLVHRDLKPDNVLVKIQLGYFFLVIGDFGSVRGTNATPPYTQYVSSLSYRSPECILTAGFYGPKMDIWAAACVYYEILILGKGRLFIAENESDQINKIHDFLGPPSSYVLQKYYKLVPTDVDEMSAESQTRVSDIEEMLTGRNKTFQWYATPSGETPRLNVLLADADKGASDFLKRMLKYDPDRRPSAAVLLEDSFLQTVVDNGQSGSAPEKKVLAPPKTSSMKSGQTHGLTRSQPSPKTLNAHKITTQVPENTPILSSNIGQKGGQGRPLVANRGKTNRIIVPGVEGKVPPK